MKIKAYIFALLILGISFAEAISLEKISMLDTRSAEITAYMALEKKLFAIGETDVVEVIAISSDGQLKRENPFPIKGSGTSISIFENLIAVSSLKNEKGWVEIFKFQKGKSSKIYETEICNGPDMLTFTPDGKKILVACEGSFVEGIEKDIPSAIGILERQGEKFTDFVLTFDHLDSTSLMAAGVRKTGVENFFASLEPEYISVSKDSKKAWVSLQENNAIGIIDIENKKIENIFPLGYLDHSLKENALDFLDDGKIELKEQPLRGMRQPDGIAVLEFEGKPFVVTANEGASLKEGPFTDEVNLKKFNTNHLDKSVFTKEKLEELGKLRISSKDSCEKGECLYTYGTRSISIFDGTTGALVWDSHNTIERFIAEKFPKYFNWNSKKGSSKFDARSKEKGAEPENVIVAQIAGKQIIFVALERMSAIAIFDATDKNNISLDGIYFNEKEIKDERGPEGIHYIPAEKSPVKNTPLLVVGYEYSERIVVYKITL